MVPKYFGDAVLGDENTQNTKLALLPDLNLFLRSCVLVQACVKAGLGIIEKYTFCHTIKRPFCRLFFDYVDKSNKSMDEMADDVELSLRDVLMSVVVEGKPLIRVVAELNDSTVMVVSATSPERDAFLENICQCTAAWAMFTLVF